MSAVTDNNFWLVHLFTCTITLLEIIHNYTLVLLTSGGSNGANPVMPPKSGHGIRCGQLILRKISKIGATRCQILKLKCTTFDFRWGYAPDPLGELMRSPRPPAVFKGPASKGRKGKGEGSVREGMGEGWPPIGESGSASTTHGHPFKLGLYKRHSYCSAIYCLMFYTLFYFVQHCRKIMTKTPSASTHHYFFLQIREPQN